MARFLLGLLALAAVVVALRGLLAPVSGPGARSAERRAALPRPLDLGAQPPARSPALDTSVGEARGTLLPAPSSLGWNDAVRLYNRGVELLAEGHYYEALLPLSEAYGAHPDSSTFCYALARVYHVLNLTREAVALLSCLRPTPDVPDAALRQLVDQLEKSAEFEMEFDAAASDHFVLSHPRGGLAEIRVGEVLDLLERARGRVGRTLGIRTRRQVPVVVYEDVDFGEATGAADWAGGRYDGKIRIAIELLERDPDEFARALRHEYVHAALHELTGARVPAWLHEGLANVVIDQRYEASRLRRHLLDRGDLPDIQMLSRSFARLPAETASVVYQQSYWMTRALVDEYGYGSVTDLVLSLEADPVLGFDEAFRDRFGQWPEDHLDRWYDDFLR